MLTVLCEKEIRRFFSRPFFYFLIGIFCLLVGTIFLNLLSEYMQNYQVLVDKKVQGTDLLVMSFFRNLNFVLVFFAPILCMDIFSYEYENSMMSILLTSKLTYWDIVLGKFLVIVVVTLFLCVLLISLSGVFWWLGVDHFDYFMGGVIGFFFHFLFFCSIGIFTSLVGINTFVAGFLHFAILLFFLMVSNLSSLSGNYFVFQMFSYLYVGEHYGSFLKGILSTRDVIYYLSGIWLMLFLGKKVLELRRLM